MINASNLSRQLKAEGIQTSSNARRHRQEGVFVQGYNRSSITISVDIDDAAERASKIAKICAALTKRGCVWVHRPGSPRIHLHASDQPKLK